MKQFIANLGIGRKLGLIAALSIGMVAVPAWQAINTQMASLATAKAEAAGVAPSGDMLKLIQLTQQHRGLSAMALGGNAQAWDKRQAKQSEVELALAKARLSSAMLGATALNNRVEAAQRNWLTLVTAVAGKSILAPQSFAQHTRLIDEELGMLEAVVDASTLALDPAPDTYYLISAVLSHLPQLTEVLGQMRARGAFVLARGEATPEQRAQLAALMGNAAAELQKTRDAFDKAFHASPDMQKLLQQHLTDAKAGAEQILKLTDEQVVRVETFSLKGQK